MSHSSCSSSENEFAMQPEEEELTARLSFSMTLKLLIMPMPALMTLFNIKSHSSQHTTCQQATCEL
jgi:hypothetical protein